MSNTMGIETVYIGVPHQGPPRIMSPASHGEPDTDADDAYVFGDHDLYNILTIEDALNYPKGHHQWIAVRALAWKITGEDHACEVDGDGMDTPTDPTKVLGGWDDTLDTSRRWRVGMVLTWSPAFGMWCDSQPCVTVKPGRSLHDMEKDLRQDDDIRDGWLRIVCLNLKQE